MYAWQDVVKNEIQVMNHLDHANLIQLYAAYESRNDIILVLELYVFKLPKQRVYALRIQPMPDSPTWIEENPQMGGFEGDLDTLHSLISQRCICLTCSVDGGELFDRIIDENYTLKELDTVVFIRQICEGLQHMHKMYILHLDLKVTTTPLQEYTLCARRAVSIVSFCQPESFNPSFVFIAA